jgi:diacylglycerol O-acyltransferase
MRDSDAFSWYMEEDPLLRSTVVSVMVLDAPPDWDRLTERLDRATRQTPGFRHRVVAPPLRLATPRWVADRNFDLSWHVRRFELAPPKTMATVLDFARKTGMAGFDRDRPLWELTVLEGLDGDGAAVVLKMHHALTDGVGGMEIAHHLFDTTPEPGDLGPMPGAPAGERLGTATLVRDAVGHSSSRALGFAMRRLESTPRDVIHGLRHPGATIGDALAVARSIARTVEPVSETLSPVMTERHLTWHYDVLELGLDEMREAVHAAGATLNDGFLAAVTAGLRLYHERHGTHVDELRLTMPVNLRKPGDPIGGNRITLMRLKVPVDIVDARKRIAAIHERCAGVRSERSLPYTDAIAGTLNLLPRAYIGEMLKHVDFLASNVPGIPFPLHLAGARVRSLYGFGPTIGAAVNFTLVSYCGRCFVGINMDTGAVPDADELLACLREGFDEVLALGTAARAG